MSAIEICPICGKETLSINFNNKKNEEGFFGKVKNLLGMSNK